MFKRILLLSGILSVALTALVYFKWMVPKVDVVQMDAVASFRLPDFESVQEGSIVTVQGFADRSGTILLGKQEVLLADSAGQVMVMCTFVPGTSAVDQSARVLLKVKGVWHPFGKNNSSFPVVLAQMTDCVLLD